MVVTGSGNALLIANAADRRTMANGRYKKDIKAPLDALIKQKVGAVK
jgi:hypothetical protein